MWIFFLPRKMIENSFETFGDLIARFYYIFMQINQIDSMTKSFGNKFLQMKKSHMIVLVCKLKSRIELQTSIIWGFHRNPFLSHCYIPMGNVFSYI
jgi:hypothetical protein